MDRKIVALLDDRPCLVDAREIEPGVDTLGEQVQRECDEIDVAGPLAVSEQCALHSLGAGHEAKLCCGDRCAAVIVRMNAEDDPITCRDMTLEPLQAVGVHVRRERLDCRREVDDHLLGAGGAPFGDHRLADFKCVIEFGAVEAFRRVLKRDCRVGLGGERFAECGAANRHLGDARSVEAKDDPPLRLGG